MHIAALILGILSILLAFIPFVWFGAPILGLVAIILGVLGRRKMLEEGRSAGVALGGIITGVFGLVIGAAFSITCTLCTACLGAAAEQAEQQNQALADQMAQDLANSMAQDLAAGAGGTATPTPGIPTPGGAVSTGGVLAVGAPVTGTVGPGMPATPEGRPYIDYSLTIAAPGNYQIDLVSPDPSAYDPYLYLMMGGAEMQHDDDGGGYPNSRITAQLVPGTYVVRVSSFRTNIPAPAAFTLTVAPSAG